VLAPPLPPSRRRGALLIGGALGVAAVAAVSIMYTARNRAPTDEASKGLGGTAVPPAPAPPAGPAAPPPPASTDATQAPARRPTVTKRPTRQKSKARQKSGVTRKKQAKTRAGAR
jgi:hypothetical protein